MDDLKLNPMLQSVVNRTRQAGLHKVAGVMHGRDINLGSVAAMLGRDLTLHHQKHARVQDGLSALRELEDHGIVKLEKQAFLKMIQKGWKGLGRMGERWGGGNAATAFKADQKALALKNKERVAAGKKPMAVKKNAPTLATAKAQGAARGKNIAQLGTLGAGAGAAGLGAGYVAGRPSNPQY